MALTFGDAKKILSQYAGRGGKCYNAEDVNLFVRQVLEYLLYSGQYGNLRKFCFTAQGGCITIPYELEVPLKVKLDGNAGTVFDKWFTWYSAADESQCVPATNALYEEPNRFPTIYDLPETGAQVGVLGTAEEAEDAHVIVQGYDITGREIYTNHAGQQISGEYLRIQRGAVRYTNVRFGKITAITKTKTRGYVQLLWVKPESNTKGFLADYSPVEEHPQYRRFRLTASMCTGNENGNLSVSVIGKIRLKPSYADEDLIPFDNVYALSLAGQQINAQYNDNVEVAAAKDKQVQELVNKENEYRRTQNGNIVEFFIPTSAGAIKNIINN